MPRSLTSLVLAFAASVVAASAPDAQAPASPRAVDFAADIQPLLAGEVPRLPRREAAAVEARPADARVGARRRRARSGAGARPGRAEPDVPAGRRARGAGDADARRGAHRRRDRHAEAVDRRAAPGGTPAPRRPPRRARRRWPPSRTGRSPTRNAATGRSSRRCRRRSRWPATRFDHPIDRFLEQARASRGLTAAPRADRRTLVRRAYLDLIGLPPTPAEVDALRRRRAPRRVGAADRHAARVAALRRALGPALARRRPLRRLGRLRVRRPPPQRLALSRLRHPRVQRRQALRPCSSPSRSPATRWTARPTTA